MDVKSLMQLSVADRTTILEQLAGKQGLSPAPGMRTESEVLASALANYSAGTSVTMHDAETLPRTLWAHYLKAPFLLIKLLELFHPHLLKLDRPLRVLYLGAGMDEVLDEGRWFSVAWALREISKHPPQITAVGPELANQGQWEASAWRYMVEQRPALADLLPGKLLEVLGTEDECANWEEYFDIVVMHHPGFVANMHDWWQDDAWMDLAGFADIPIIGTSFDAVDFEFDKHGLAASGRIVDQVLWNSAAHVNPGSADVGTNRLETRLQWGGVLWSTTRDKQFVEGMESQRQHRAFDWFAQHHFPLLQSPHPLTKYLRCHYSCPMQFDDVHQHLLVTDDIRINRASGRIEAFGQTLEPGPVVLEVLATASLAGRLKLAPALIAEVGEKLDLNQVAREHSLRVKSTEAVPDKH
ncbi:MAG: hypothetical protein ACRER5_02905 [Pseudomonas sp.]